MKTNLRRKIRAFLQSEEGKVSVKAPLSLGVIGGSLLLAQAIFDPTVRADSGCGSDCNTCVSKCIKWTPSGRCETSILSCADS